MARLETSGYYALGIPFYLAFIALEIALTRRKGLKAYGFADTLGNFSGGLGEIVVGLFIGPYLLALYDFGYQHLALIRWEESSWIPWVLAFFVSDFCYYIYHRAGHSVACFWAIHGVHHQSEKFNISVATRHPWFSDIYSFPFYIFAPLLGITAFQFFVAISIISFYSLTIHSQTFHRPSLYILTTPATHIVHHATNPRYIGKNLGAMFTIWDRLFGTYVEVDPSDLPILGTRRGYETHNGALSQWIYVRDLIYLAARAETWGESMRVFFSHPGFRPKNVSLPAITKPRDDAEIPWATKLYTLFQFTVALLFATYIFWSRDDHSTLFLALGAAFIFWSTSSLGSLLDGSDRAALYEGARLVLGTLFAVILIGELPHMGLGLALLAGMLLGFVGCFFLTEDFRNSAAREAS